ncbi:MAG TPA: beta-N-acetylhexosaminidase [Microbacteriaceae bacterium]|nr:beta-N-acetylhexosaminidase [Microbacteriaceae bacterium]
MGFLPPLLPLPNEVRQTGEGFELTAATTVAAESHLVGVAVQLQNMLRPATGLPLRLVGASVPGSALRLYRDSNLAAEGYRLEVGPDGVRVAGGSAAGVFYGCQALRQLLPAEVFRSARVPGVTWSLPGVHIADAPRWAWRGMMLDVARHFIPKPAVLRMIDLMAAHRLNVLQLHLTDDQGWRLEIRRYPRLTDAGAWRRSSQVGAGEAAPQDGRPHGGYYTQADAREIVAYARERAITVVPEIDAPGHAQAVLAAYPELGVTGRPVETSTVWDIGENVLNVEESTVRFVTDVLDEVMDLFDSPFIGVGGDEYPTVQWQGDPRTRQRMRELRVATPDGLRAWFLGQLDSHVSAAGRRIVGWEEILEGELTPGAVVASWRGMAGARAAALAGHDVVSCPDERAYLDYRESDAPDEPVPVSVPVTVRDVYELDPRPQSLPADAAAHILGGQANVWTEHMDSPRVVDYHVFPRLCALAEALWSRRKDWPGFERRLRGHLRRLDAAGVEYRHSGGPLPWQRRPGVAGWPRERQG